MMDKIYLGRAAQDVYPGLESLPITGVELVNYDGDIVGIAGDDTGRIITALHPDGTDAMAQSILAQLGGFVYRPFEAQDAMIHPAMELGDGVTVGGMYSVAAQMDTTFDDLYSGDLSAPDSGELEDEYPYKSPTQRLIERNFAKTRSLITKTAEEIRLEVTNELEGLSASFSVSLDSIKAEVQGLNGTVATLEQTATSIKSTVSAQGSAISELEQLIDSITLSVSNGSTSSTITLKAGETVISSQNITMSGLVTYTGLASGTTTIDGGCIKTGTIDADRLNLTGEITFSDLASAVQSGINDAYTMAEAAQEDVSAVSNTVDAWRYNNGTYIDGTKLMTGTVTASYLQGGTIEILSASELVVGVITPTWSSSSNIALQLASVGALRLGALGGNAFLFAGDSPSDADSFLQCVYGANAVSCYGNFIPAGNWYCGTAGGPWYGMHTYTEVVVTSDRNKKHGISYDMARYDAFFDALKPAFFELDNSPDDRVHLGLVAQDVEDALIACGLEAYDLGALCKTSNGDVYDYALRYGEFIALCIYQIQLLKARVAVLEGAA